MSSPAAVRDQTPFIELSRVNRELKASILAEIEALALFLASKGVATGRDYPKPLHPITGFCSSRGPKRSIPGYRGRGSQTDLAADFLGVTERQMTLVVEGIRGVFAHG